MPCKGLDCEKKEMTNILLDRKSAATAGLEYHKINFFFFFENKIDRKTYQFKLCNQVTASKIWFKIFLFITTILEDPHHKIPLHLTANKHQLSVVMLSFCHTSLFGCFTHLLSFAQSLNIGQLVS